MNADDTRRREVAELACLLPAPAERDLPAGRQHSARHAQGRAERRDRQQRDQRADAHHPPHQARHQRVVLDQLDASGGAAFRQAMDAGMTRQQVAEVFFTSAEYRLVQVQDIYRQFMDRELDASGRQSWVGLAMSGAADQLVRAAILGEMQDVEFFDKTAP